MSHLIPSRKTGAALCILASALVVMLGATGDTPSGGGPGPGVQSEEGPSHEVSDDTSIWSAGGGGDTARPTDSTNYTPPDDLPNLIRLLVYGWEPTESDPFVGAVIPGDEAHVFRLDIEFEGLVNPPGTIGLNGLPFDPFQHGPNPLYGFVEIDIDGDVDTGGSLDAEVQHRYLSNVARFDGVPHGPTAGRAARWKSDRNSGFNNSPYIERSGADFELVLDGLGVASVIEANGAPPTGADFGPGDAWLVEGRFFQRTTGYLAASKSFGGSEEGLYDPVVTLLFHHNNETDGAGITTVTLVYALDMIGAAMITGEPVQPVNYDVSDHTSVKEAMHDVIHSVSLRPLSGPAGTLSNAWASKEIGDHLDPTQWRMTAIFGGTYSAPGIGRYIYSSIGFDTIPGDVNGDGVVDETDAAIIQGIVALHDGGALDSGPGGDGAVHLYDFASNFSVYDVNGDGVIDDADIQAVTPPIPGDLNGDGFVNSQDLGILLGSWGVCPPQASSCPADINGDGVVNAQDLAILLGSWG